MTRTTTTRTTRTQTTKRMRKILRHSAPIRMWRWRPSAL